MKTLIIKLVIFSQNACGFSQYLAEDLSRDLSIYSKRPVVVEAECGTDPVPHINDISDRDIKLYELRKISPRRPKNTITHYITEPFQNKLDPEYLYLGEKASFCFKKPSYPASFSTWWDYHYRESYRLILHGISHQLGMVDDNSFCGTMNQNPIGCLNYLPYVTRKQARRVQECLNYRPRLWG